MTAATARKRIVANLERLELLQIVDPVALKYLCAAIGSGSVEEIEIWLSRLGLTESDRLRARVSQAPFDPQSPWNKFFEIGRPTLAELLSAST